MSELEQLPEILKSLNEISDTLYQIRTLFAVSAGVIAGTTVLAILYVTSRKQ